MDRIIDFTIFCLEIYKLNHHMNGKDALEVFEKNDVFNYIRECYDILHTAGEGYINRDIDRYIDSRIN